ncbi:MAG: hypothetical protein J7578_05335 [Chitinophagaceae bacterium]|nr:hypothetical protein [Chitinophagaceae bacterium]
MNRAVCQLALITLVVLACQDQGVKGSESHTGPEGISTTPTEHIDRQSPAASTLIGRWAMTGETNESFRLTRDSLYYPNNHDAYLYRATADSIHFYMVGSTSEYAWKMKGSDTLEMIVDTAQSFFYYRMK